MSDDRRRLAQLTLDELADALARPEPGSNAHNWAMAEFSRRRMVAELENTIAQKDAMIAQTRAATAAEDTARFTKQNAFYMLLSVIALATSSFLNLLISLWQIIAN
jgi:hypothetical protein